MLILLIVGNDRFMYEVASLQALRERVSVHFGPLAPGSSLRITYRVPVAYGNENTPVDVNTEGEFQASIQVWNTVIRPLQLQRQDPLLPTYEAWLVPQDMVQTTVASPVVHADGGGQRKRGPAVDYAQPRKAAVSVTDSIPQVAATTSPINRPSAVVDTDWYHSHDKAEGLLKSFIPASLPEGPTIRTTLRGGQASVRIPFDAYNPPDVNALREVVQSEFLRRLSNDERDKIMSGTATQSIKFLMYATMATVPAEVDVEDNADVMFVSTEVRNSGNDFSVQLVCEWVDASSVPTANDDVRRLTTDMVEVVLPPRSALTFNQAHTPKREHRERTYLSIEGDD